MYYELEGVRKETAVPTFQEQSQHFTGHTKENCEKCTKQSTAGMK
jgi:hypothetical protein